MSCSSCGRLTQEEIKEIRDRSRAHPIYGTDFTHPLSFLIEGIRVKVAHLRGELHDIEYAYPAWAESLKDIEGLLTCGLVCLYRVKEEMAELETKRERSGDVRTE